MRKTKKFVVTILIVVYLLGIAPRQAVVPVLAEGEQTQDPNPSPSPEPSSEPSPSPDPAILEDPSPTPSPSPDPCTSDCPPAEVDQSNDSTTNNEVTDIANTGDNQIGPTPSPEPLATDEATDGTPPQETQSQDNSNADGNAVVDTGNAVADVNVLNLTNSNIIGSNYTFKIENIYVEADGSVNLANATATEVDSQTLNVIADQNNSGTVNNVITAIANTGNNLINAASGAITTGNAYAIVNVFNFINTNLIGSELQLVIINIFGTLTGDIILPEPQALELPNGLVLGDVTQHNSAQLTNGITNSANTGNNLVTGTSDVDGAIIQTGNATSQTNVTNVVNTNLLGGIFYQLFVNNFGSWNGQFLGWGTNGPQDPVYGTMIFDFEDEGLANGLGGFVSADQGNVGTVNNLITASANTGGNSIYGEDGSIITGNAFSSVNLINFFNTNVIASKIFFGVINIFGELNGNIGGASYFATTSQTQVATETQTQTQTEEQRVPGGQLSSEISTNVGTHVNPGDTVMFFITVKNTGTGPVYDGKLTFNLYDANDELAAIDITDLGTLAPGQKAYISFGLVLSESAPGGLYQGLIKTEGKIGPDNENVESFADTYFQVSGAGFLSSLIPEVEAASDQEEPQQPQELQSGISYSENWGYIFLLLFFTTYIRMLQVLYKKRNEEVMHPSDPFLN